MYWGGTAGSRDGSAEVFRCPAAALGGSLVSLPCGVFAPPLLETTGGDCSCSSICIGIRVCV